MQLSEQELIELEGLVIDVDRWGLLKKIFNAQINQFWNALRLTNPADEQQVVSNHKIAAGVEAALGDMVKWMENEVYIRRTQAQGPEILEDQTKEFLQ